MKRERKHGPASNDQRARIDAELAGRTWYDGPPCRKCSGTRRDTIRRSCVVCDPEYDRNRARNDRTVGRRDP